MHRKLEHIFTILGQNLPSGTFPGFVLSLENSCELQLALPLSLFRTWKNHDRLPVLTILPSS